MYLPYSSQYCGYSAPVDLITSRAPSIILPSLTALLGSCFKSVATSCLSPTSFLMLILLNIKGTSVKCESTTLYSDFFAWWFPPPKVLNWVGVALPGVMARFPFPRAELINFSWASVTLFSTYSVWRETLLLRVRGDVILFL